MLITLPDILSADDVATARTPAGQRPWEDGPLSAGTTGPHGQAQPAAAPWLRAARRHPADGAGRAEPLGAVLSVPPCRFASSRRMFNRYARRGQHLRQPCRQRHPPTPWTAVAPNVRTDVSCTVFLNDPDDYDGGELTVSDTYGTRGVKLPAGHAVLYPGTSVHQVDTGHARRSGWPAFSGSRAWCAATNSAACCSTWT
jgi:PKHD-type hydroxylase